MHFGEECRWWKGLVTDDVHYNAAKCAHMIQSKQWARELSKSCRLCAATAAAAGAAAVAVHPPPALLAQPSSVHVLHQQRARPAWQSTAAGNGLVQPWFAKR